MEDNIETQGSGIMVPLRIVSRRAGHSNTTTSPIYSYAIQSMDEVASEALEDILKPKIGGKQ